MAIFDEPGKEFKAALKAGAPKMGLFLNATSPTIAEQLSFAGRAALPTLRHNAHAAAVVRNT